jgi:murein L,D-transpeptidase YafK
MKPAGDARLVQFFKSWINAWENKKLDEYMAHYHSAFIVEGKNKAAWRAHKAHLNGTYKKIDVAPTHIQYLRHPKYSWVRFTQNYRSWLKNGAAGHQSIGTKTILVGEEDGELKIITEDFTNQKW